MNHIVLGIGLGLVAGAIATGLMIPMTFPDKRAAIGAAFVSRFAIGFLTANTALPINPILAGAGIGLVVSAPDALVTKAYVPILGMGTLLGALCGVAVWLWG
jgi:hypothetical protein